MSSGRGLVTLRGGWRRSERPRWRSGYLVSPVRRTSGPSHPCDSDGRLLPKGVKSAGAALASRRVGVLRPCSHLGSTAARKTAGPVGRPPNLTSARTSPVAEGPVVAARGVQHREHVSLGLELGIPNRTVLRIVRLYGAPICPSVLGGGVLSGGGEPVMGWGPPPMSIRPCRSPLGRGRRTVRPSPPRCRGASWHGRRGPRRVARRQGAGVPDPRRRGPSPLRAG